MVIDDEPTHVDGLEQFLLRQEFSNCEIYKAYSAQEALTWMERTKIDIILTDIQMPEITGLELQKKINEQWPRCKVIFLTGYDDFYYIQDAMRNDSVDYLLKTGDKEEILKAIYKAISLLEQEVEINEILDKAKKQARDALPCLQANLLTQILDGTHMKMSLHEQFNDLDIPLQASQEVLLLLCRVDDWREEMSTRDKSLLLYAIKNITEEFLHKSASTVPLEYQKSRIAWFIQPQIVTGDEDWIRIIRFVHGTLEQIQSACKTLLGLRISFIVDDSPTVWELLGQKFEDLNLNFTYGMGMDEELLHIPYVPSKDRKEMVMSSPNYVRPHRISLKNMGKIAESLDSGNKEIFHILFSQFFGEEKDEVHFEEKVKLEIYYSLVSVFLSKLNSWDLYEELTKIIDLNKLTQIEAHASWWEALKYFLRLGDAIYELKTKGMLQHRNHVIEILNDYIESHIDGDVSLTKLAEIACLNPSYLSRMYKQVTGSALSETIMEKKIAKSKQLLLEPNLSVNDVAVKMGFLYPNLFYRFFKKATEMTPQEYRDIQRSKK